MSCLTMETLAAWSLGDLTPAEANACEDHWFACDRCARRAEGMLALTRTLAGMTAAFLTRERRELLEKSGPLEIVRVLPGQGGRLSFGGRDTALWVLQGDFSGAERVDCEFVLEGTPFASFPDVPFDAERGEVALACRTHYAAVAPARFAVRLTVRAGAVTRPPGEYELDHVFPSV